MKLTKITYMALEQMRGGLYLLRQKDAEGLSVGNMVSIKSPVKAGTIDELLENGFIRPSLHSRNLYLLTESGRNYRQTEI